MESKKCPKCGKPLIFSSSAFRCQNRRCSYVETIQKDVNIVVVEEQKEEKASSFEEDFADLYNSDDFLDSALFGLGNNASSTSVENMGSEYDYHVSGYKKTFKYGSDEEKYLKCLFDSEYIDDIFDSIGNVNSDVLRAVKMIFSKRNNLSGYDSLIRLTGEITPINNISKESRIISLLRVASLNTINLSSGILIKNRQDLLRYLLKNDEDSIELLTKHFSSVLYFLDIEGQDSNKLSNQIFTYLGKTVAYVDISNRNLFDNRIINFGNIDFFIDHLFESVSLFEYKIHCINAIGFADTYVNVSSKKINDRRIYSDIGYSQEELPAFLKLVAFYTIYKETIPFANGLKMRTGLTQLVNLSSFASECLHECYIGEKSRFLRVFQFLISSGCFDSPENKYHSLVVTDPFDDGVTLKELACMLSFEEFVDKLKKYYVPLKVNSSSVKFLFNGRFVTINDAVNTICNSTLNNSSLMIKESLYDKKNGILTFFENYGLDKTIFEKIINK